MSAISTRLREGRAKARLTQEQLAQAAGISVRTVQAYEQAGGDRQPRHLYLEALEEALGTSLAGNNEDRIRRRTSVE
jgi:transcriptional regulator with XRE-family HTH domain